MAIPIKIYTGKTSRKDIIIDLVRVVANPIRKNTANDRPIIVVILFILIIPHTLFLTIWQHLKIYGHHICHQLIEHLMVNYFHPQVKGAIYMVFQGKTKPY